MREDPLPSGSLRYPPLKGASRPAPGLIVCTGSAFVTFSFGLFSDGVSITATEAKRVIPGGRVRVGDVAGLMRELLPVADEETSDRFVVRARAARGWAGVVAR